MQAIAESNTMRKDFNVAEILKRNQKVFGIHRLVMKAGCDDFCGRSIHRIRKSIKAKGIEVIVFKPKHKEDNFFNTRVIINLAQFKAEADVIFADRMTEDISAVGNNVYTRDLFGSD